MSELAKGLGQQCASAMCVRKMKSDIIEFRSGVRLDVVTFQRLPYLGPMGGKVVAGCWSRGFSWRIPHLKRSRGHTRL